MTNPQISHPHPPLHTNSAGDHRISALLGLRDMATATCPPPPCHSLQSLPLPEMSACVTKAGFQKLPTTYDSLHPCQPQTSTCATRSPCPRCSMDFSGCIQGFSFSLHKTQKGICLCFSSCHCPPCGLPFRRRQAVPVPPQQNEASGMTAPTLLPTFPKLSHSSNLRVDKQTPSEAATILRTSRHAQTVSVKS